MGKKPCCDKANVKRGRWTAEEDLQLRLFIQQHGTHGEWTSLPKKAGLRRCGKSCRLRWFNYLRPGIKHGNYTEGEDNAIYSLYGVVGSRWSLIASHLPGRTDNDIKNYWNTRLQFKWLQWQKSQDFSATENNCTSSNVNYRHFPLAALTAESSSSDRTAGLPDTNHTPLTEIRAELNLPLALGPNQDSFETAALLHAICNTNMNGQDTRVSDSGNMSRPLPFWDSSSSSSVCSFLSAKLNSGIIAEDNTLNCKPATGFYDQFCLLQEKEEVEYSNVSDTGDSATVLWADEDFQDTCPNYTYLSFFA